MEQLNVPSLDGLTELANRDGVDIKPTLLRVMTDLYVQKPKHSAEEERHYTELALRLIDQVDAATRTIVTERLKKYPDVPRAIMQRLAPGHAEQATAAPPSPPAAAVAPPVIWDAAPAAPTARPPARPVTGSTPAELSELFLTADAAERRLILLNLDTAPLPAAAPILRQTAEDAIRRLEMAALAHNSEGFSREIERSLGISRAFARRLIDDESGEPILVVASTLGMPADALQRILLCLNPAISQSVLRVYELSTLYDEIDPQSALRLVQIWRVAHKAEQRPAQTAHRPQYWHDASKAQPAAVAPRPAIRWEQHAQLRKAEG